MIETLLGLAALMVLLFLRVPIGFAMIAVGAIGIAELRSWKAMWVVSSTTIYDIATSPVFVVLPLFLLMGMFVARARLSDDLFDAANAWLGHLRGGLAISTVAASGGFAAISGNSVATAVTMAKVAVPSMRRYRYADSLAAGTVAAGGTLGILIPPSNALIVYGLLTDTDIGQLFMAGIVPGIMTVLLYIAVVAMIVGLNPAKGPPGPRSDWRTRMRTLGRIWGVVALFLMILGGISAGAFTPSEAGAMGAVGALLFAMGRRKINWKQFYLALVEAATTTAMLFAVLFGALLLNQFIGYSGVAGQLSTFVTEWDVSPLVAMLFILVVYIILGMFVDGVAMILLTVPVFVPIVQSLGFDLIWFGIVLVIVVEMSLITPPIGLNVFVMKSALPDVPLGTLYRGIMPFFCADIVRLLIVLFVPAVALWLPQLLR